MKRNDLVKRFGVEQRSTTPGVDSWAIVERADGHLCLYEDCADAIRDLRAERDGLREALTRAAENMKIAAEFHDCVNCTEGHTQARTALAFARTIEKYDGALAALAQEP